MKTFPLIILLSLPLFSWAQMQPPPPTKVEQREAARTKLVEQAGVGTIGALDARNGFRKYELGVSIVEMTTLKPRGKDLYMAQGEAMTIGEAKLSMLAFGAEGGRLSTIYFSATEEDNCRKLLDALTAQYGPGQEAAYNKLAWQGNAVTMIYETKKRFVSGTTYTLAREVTSCDVYITSNAISAEREAARKAAAKKAAGDL